jgi:hypothetical protein
MFVVDIKNKAGSVQHYFHYILGYLIPIFHNYEKIFNSHNANVILKSCGILDKHTLSFDFKKVHLLDKDDFIYNKIHSLYLLEIEGRDKPQFYDYTAFQSAVERMKVVWNKKWSEALNWANNQFIDKKHKILLIRRIAPNTFYYSNKSESRGAGSSRRSIKNHDNLLMSLRSEFDCCLDCSLENMDLVKQCALFHACDLVVAQHGAALANTIWMKPDSFVIEIVPRHFDGGKRFRDFFSPLSKACRLKHFVSYQNDSHSDVDIINIISIINSKYVIL